MPNSVKRELRLKLRSGRRFMATSTALKSSASFSTTSSRMRPAIRTRLSSSAMRFFIHLSSGWPFVSFARVGGLPSSPIANCAPFDPGCAPSAPPGSAVPFFPTRFAASDDAPPAVAEVSAGMVSRPIQNAMAAVASQPVAAMAWGRGSVTFMNWGLERIQPWFARLSTPGKWKSWARLRCRFARLCGAHDGADAL